MHLRPPLTKIKEGSVKNIYQEEDHLLFFYSDRYSIYDWGEMPDAIPNKGKALSLMAALFFKKLQRENIPNHFIEATAREGFGDGISVKKVAIKTAAEYRNERPVQALVPLEVIFRFGIPVGSSLPDRNPKYKMGDLFDDPLIEFSTKLENRDIYLSEKEAQTLANLSNKEMSKLKNETKKVALILKRVFMQEMKITLWDGKFEWAFGEINRTTGERDFFLVDSIGPDELRLTYKDLLLSKEFLRQFYKDSGWKLAMILAKREYQDEWKNYLLSKELRPTRLDDKGLHFASLIYTSLANMVAKSEGLAPLFDAPTDIDELYRLYEEMFKKSGEQNYVL